MDKKEENQFIRQTMILGEESLNKLNNSKVIIFGLGGVGSYVAEALARAGIGTFTLVDSDKFSISNLNRQLGALHSTVGRLKTEVTAERIKDINPDAKISIVNEFYLPQNSELFSLSSYDYIADAIDTVTAKTDLAQKAYKLSVPIISCMGTGNKKDPTLFRISDIFKTSVCPLCRTMRYELKKRDIPKLNVVWSPEPPSKKISLSDDDGRTPGSLSFVPGAAGLIMAGKIIMDLSGK